MKRFLILIGAILLGLSVRAQSVDYSCRYWFDRDIEQIATATFTGNTAQMEWNVSTLADGLHTLHVQVMDTAEIWSAPYNLFFIKTDAHPTEEMSYTYWFDRDFEGRQTGTLGNGSLFIDVEGLSDGMHTLHIAMQGNTMNLTHNYLFVKLPVLNPESQLEYHCWFDQDYSTLVTGPVGDGYCLIDVSALPIGSHNMILQLEDGTTLNMPMNFGFNRTPMAFVTVEPEAGGTATGQLVDSICTLNAIPNEGYDFVGWTHNGEVIATDPEMSFPLYNDTAFVASFQLRSYDIVATANIAEGGTVEGSGTYYHFDECTLTATPAEGYRFHFWSENGELASTDPTYTFTVNGARNVEAYFAWQGDTPEGAINGLFSIADGRQVYFSQGNLQYQKSTQTWSFMEHQYDVLGTEGEDVGEDHANVDIVSYFGWATSGCPLRENMTNYYYQPYNTYGVNGNNYGPTVYNADLLGEYINGDWGIYNAISNGGNVPAAWKTMTRPEWTYLFEGRPNASSKWGRGNIDGINGVFLLPDEWTQPEGVAEMASGSSSRFNTNNYALIDWLKMQAAGAVFLPAAGWRTGTVISEVNEWVSCWSTYGVETWFARNIWIQNSSIDFADKSNRHRGYPVRLVNYVTYNIGATPSPAEGGSIEGTGIYEQGTEITLTATPAEGYTFVNWTEDGEVVSTDAEYTFTVEGNRTLVANFGLNTHEVSVIVSPEEGGTVTGAGVYEHGAECTLTATANTGYTFINWTEDGEVVSTDAEYTFTVEGNRALVANFGLNTHEVSVIVSPEEGGTVTGAGVYNHGDTATLTATANEGYHFVFWMQGHDVISYDSIYSFIVEEDRTIVAAFDIEYVQIEVVANPTEGGSAHGSGEYGVGNECYLYAYPNEGYTFVNWTENGVVLSTEAEYTYIVTHAATIVANFSINNYEVSAYATPEEGGTIEGTGIYTHGATATLTATPNTGYTFVSWNENGLVLTTDATYSFTVTADRELEAVFSAISYNITATAFPEVGGEISIEGEYTYGATMTLTATANTGFTFINWTEDGNVVSTDAQYTFTVEGNRTLVANFSMIEYTIVTMASPQEGGITRTNGLTTYGATLMVMAFPNEGYEFVSWTDNGEVISTEAQFPYTVTGDKVLVANFSLIEYDITAMVYPEEAGTVTGAGTYNYGTTVTLTATANEGYTFVSWSENNEVVSFEPTISFTATGDRELLAYFSTNSYEVMAYAVPEEGGSISGTGYYNHGATATLTATANEGYTFESWYEYGVMVSDEATYSFTVTSDRELEAYFTINSYDITATANPEEGGLVEGADTYEYGTECLLTAIAYEGYEFVSWTENGFVVSTEAEYTFTVTGDRDLVANFEVQGPITNHWTPVYEGLYSQTSVIIAVIQIDGIEQHSNMLELGVFCGEECRGTAIATLFEPTQRHLVYMNVYGEDGHELTFRLFDHSIHQELDLTPPASILFTEDGYGSLLEPYVVNFTSVVEITATASPAEAGYITGAGEYIIGSTCTLTATALDDYQFVNWTLDGTEVSTEPSFTFTVTEAAHYVAHFLLVQIHHLSYGWSWWSTYIEQSNIDGLLMLENSLGGAGIRIQGKNASVDRYDYQGQPYWYGNLNALNNEQMFKINTSEDCDAVIVGDKAMPADHPITINYGWNWIGVVSDQGMAIETALGDFSPEHDDVIKGRNVSATYFSYGNYTLWYGNLNTLEPGQGYMYRSCSETPKTLVYPTARGNEELKPNITPDDNVFVPAGENYADNMLITAVIELDGEELRSDSYELAAFAGDECRGSVKLMYIDAIDRYVAFLLAFGDKAEHLHFTLTDGRGTSQSDDRLMYEIDGIVGSLTEPITLHFGALSMDDDLLIPVTIYPNPSRGIFNVEGEGILKVEVIDAYGQVILSEEIENDFLQINLGDKAAGAYLLRVVTNNGITTRKLVKKS